MMGPGLLALATSVEGGGGASLSLLQAVAPQADIGGEEFRAVQEADSRLQPLRRLAAG